MIASDSFAPGLSLSGTLTIDVGGCGLAQAATRSASKKAVTLGVLDKVSSLLIDYCINNAIMMRATAMEGTHHASTWIGEGARRATAARPQPGGPGTVAERSGAAARLRSELRHALAGCGATPRSRRDCRTCFAGAPGEIAG